MLLWSTYLSAIEIHLEVFIMDYAKESLRLHKEWGGKIEVICTVPCKTK